MSDPASQRANLLRRYHAADPETLANGRTWYAEAQAEARRLAAAGPAGFGIVRAAAVLAILSPGNRWGENVRAAREVIATGTSRRAYPANVAKAARVLAGENPRDCARGPKVSVFWRAICGDPDAMTLDRHAIRAAGIPCVPAPWPNAEARAELIRSYREVAARVGETVRDFQAIVWLVERGSVPSDAITRVGS